MNKQWLFFAALILSLALSIVDAGAGKTISEFEAPVIQTTVWYTPWEDATQTRYMKHIVGNITPETDGTEATYDLDAGYTTGSTIRNSVTNAVYQCVVSTNDSAIWFLVNSDDVPSHDHTDETLFPQIGTTGNRHDGYFDDLYCNTLNPTAVTDPMSGMFDSDCAGTDKEIARRRSNATTVTEDAEVADQWFTQKIAGSWVTMFHMDGSSKEVRAVGQGTTVQGLIPVIHTKELTIPQPDLQQVISDAYPFFQCDSKAYPNGCKIVKVSIQLPADAAYTMGFEEWSGDPPAAVTTIEDVATTGTDNYMAVVVNHDIAADAWVFFDLPTTDIDWVVATVVFYGKVGS